MSRQGRQEKAVRWSIAAFGAEHQASGPQRAIRMFEEATEAFQAVIAADCADDPATMAAAREIAHKLVDFVMDRPAGEIGQELGGLGLTVLLLAAATGHDADTCELEEVIRVTSKPLAHFHARNQAKNAAGFDMTGGAYPTGKPEEADDGAQNPA